MTDVDYEDMEVALTTTLRSLEQSHGVRTVDVYSGQLDKGLREAVGAFPAVYVSIPGVEFQDHNRVDKATATILVYYCDRSLRKGAGRSGAQTLMQAARGKLHRKNVLYGRWEKLMVRRERVLWVDPGTGMAVCEGRYMTRNVV